MGFRVWVHNEEQMLYINMKRFRGGLVFKAHEPMYHSTLGLRAIKKKKFGVQRERGNEKCAEKRGKVFGSQGGVCSLGTRWSH